jgi:hypothetical protein
MSEDLKRPRDDILSDSENEEDNFKRARVEENQEILDTEQITGERMMNILNDEKQKGATIDGFFFIKKNGIWDGRVKCSGQCKSQNACFLAKKDKKKTWDKVKIETFIFLIHVT